MAREHRHHPHQDWCDKYLGTNAPPPTNGCYGLGLVSPVSGPTPFSLQSGPPFADAWTFTASNLGSNQVKVTCWSNGTYVAESSAGINNGCVQVAFPNLGPTSSSSALFRVRDQLP